MEYGPNFAIYDDINIEEVKAEFLIAMTKIRWDRMVRKRMKSRGGKMLQKLRKKKRLIRFLI